MPPFGMGVRHQSLTVLTFVETPLFAKLLERYLSDDEYAELQTYLG